MKAYIGIRDQPHYRRDAFAAGLTAAGHSVKVGQPTTFDRDTVFVCWNRYSNYHEICNRVEQAGGKTLICENGYFGKDENGHQRYAIALHGHNGSGSFPVGDGSRWDALGVNLAPWRADGEHVLVCGQRGIGSPTMASPPNWHEGAATRLRKLTKRPIKIRTHPGNNAPAVPLAQDLAGAWACVIWSSGSGVQALVAGVPVFYSAPNWICEGAASYMPSPSGPTAIDRPFMDDSARLSALQRMAWAQWSIAETASGEPFRRLLSDAAR